MIVVSELALAVVLAAGAGLLARSFQQIVRVPAGFVAARVLTLDLTATGRKYPDGPRVAAGYRELRERIAAIPGVEQAAVVSAPPLSQIFSWGPITIEGREPPPGEKFINADQRMISPGYFRTMGIRLLEGRDFDDRDTRTAPRVAIVDARMAQDMWSGASPVGRRLRLGGADSTSPWVTVVGVADRVKQDALDADSRIAVYVPHAQYPARAMTIVVRASAAADTIAPDVRQTIRAFDPDLPIYNVRSMENRVFESLARRRFAVLLFSCFATVAVLLAAVGVYGVIAYVVSQGTRELGIRLALGASPRQILAMVMRQGMLTATWGGVAGGAAAALLARFIRALLFDVRVADPITLAAVAVLLVSVAFAATIVPARRAARIDPMVSLRTD